MAISTQEVCTRLAESAFGRPLVSNMYRGLVAEVIVGSVLSPGWRWCSEDWAGWDFVHESGHKLEVKQSASLQSWSTGKISNCTFSIRASSGFWEGATWVEQRDRKASIYVFAHHPGTNPASTDHRDPLQWKFYVIPASALPATQTISLGQIRTLTNVTWKAIDRERSFPCGVDALADAVDGLQEFLGRSIRSLPDEPLPGGIETPAAATSKS